MTLAEALAAANAGQQGAQFSAGGRTYVLPPGVQGAPLVPEPAVEPPQTVEEVLALPRRPLVDPGSDTPDVLRQTAGGGGGGGNLFGGLGGMFDPTDPRNDPDRNIAGNIGVGLRVANRALGGSSLIGSGLSMAGQGISANRRTSALDDILTGAGLSETPEGTAMNDWWSQGFTGLFGAGEPAQAAAAREIAEEANRPEGRVENAMLALSRMSDRVNEELARQGYGPGQYEEPRFVYDERTERGVDWLGAGSASLYSAPAADALANLADVGALPGQGMSVALNTPGYSAASGRDMAGTWQQGYPDRGWGPPQYAPEELNLWDQDATKGEMDAWAAAADQAEQAQADAAAQQAASDSAAVRDAALGITAYQGGPGNRGYDSFSDWVEAAFG